MSKFLQLFNTFAFVIVALQGDSYLAAARKNVLLMRAAGLSATTNNLLVEDMIGFGTTASALLAGVLAAVLGIAVFKVPLVVTLLLVAFAILLGYCVVLVPLMALHSSCVATFTVFSIDRTLLKDEPTYAELCAAFDRISKKSKSKQKNNQTV